jgi:hypothetical protein
MVCISRVRRLPEMRTICYANRHFATIQLSMKTRFMLFQKTIVRYLFGIAAVMITFGLRIWLIPLTGTGAPFEVRMKTSSAADWV